MKFAIFNYEGMKENCGGPRGYLFNLYTGFNLIGAESPALISSKRIPSKSFYSSGKSGKVNVPSNLRKILSFIKKGLLVKKEFKKTLRGYDVIHVQSVEDCFFVRKFARFKGKIIVTPHMPEPLKDEQLSFLRSISKKKYRTAELFYNYVERKAYKYANAFIFPSPGAMSIYQSFPGFLKYSKNKPVEFVMTGVQERPQKEDSKSFRANIGVSENDFVVAFIGRHNFIKGYDRLVKCFDKLKKEGVTVVVAGAQTDDIKCPNDNKWIELGYINNTPDLMNAADVIVVPNRNTYYDLVIIESLSHGKIVISSNTGGNVDISKNTKGLVLFDNDIEESFFDAVTDVIELSEQQKSILEKENTHFYSGFGNLNAFSTNYLKAMNKLLGLLLL